MTNIKDRQGTINKNQRAEAPGKENQIKEKQQTLKRVIKENFPEIKRFETSHFTRTPYTYTHQSRRPSLRHILLKLLHMTGKNFLQASRKN